MPVRTGRRDWLWGLALGAVAAVAAIIIYAVVSGSDVKTYDTVAGVDCQSGERLEYHVHAFLSVLIDGQEVPIPPGTGIRDECLFWLHTHNDNLIHVEAPSEKNFTLGQFFAIWGQPLSGTALLDRTVDAEHQIVVTVNGEPFEEDPATIPLTDGSTIVIQYGPPFGEAPPSPFEQ